MNSHSGGWRPQPLSLACDEAGRASKYLLPSGSGGSSSAQTRLFPAGLVESQGGITILLHPDALGWITAVNPCSEAFGYEVE